ncbi:MAG: hypothetical protein OHK0015_05660 [Chloroflexi bacterium OHK40]
MIASTGVRMEYSALFHHGSVRRSRMGVYIENLSATYKDGVTTVVLPEFVPAHWWEHLLHNQTGILIKTALMFQKGIVITSVPYRLER